MDLMVPESGLLGLLLVAIGRNLRAFSAGRTSRSLHSAAQWCLGAVLGDLVSLISTASHGSSPQKKGTDCHLENNGCAIWMRFERGCTRRMKTSVHIRSPMQGFDPQLYTPTRILVIHLIRPGLLLMSSFLNNYPTWDRATWLFYTFWIAWKQPVGDTQWYTTRSPYQNIERTLCDSVLATYLILYRLVAFYSISQYILLHRAVSYHSRLVGWYYIIL